MTDGIALLCWLFQEIIPAAVTALLAQDLASFGSLVDRSHRLSAKHLCAEPPHSTVNISF